MFAKFLLAEHDRAVTVPTASMTLLLTKREKEEEKGPPADSPNGLDH